MKVHYLIGILAFVAVGFFGASNAIAAVCNPTLLKATAFGQQGAVVMNLQQCLLDAGYSIPAGPTGYYGTQTRTAVKSFYAALMNITDWDGNSVGPKGRAVLLSRASGAIKGGPGPTGPSSSAGFKKITSAAEFQKYIQASTDQNNYSGAMSGLSRGVMTQGAVPPMAPTPSATAGTPGAVQQDNAVSTPSSAEGVRSSDTNVQVAGIDEPDIVKTDGTNIYISQQSWGPIMYGVATPPPSAEMPMASGGTNGSVGISTPSSSSVLPPDNVPGAKIINGTTGEGVASVDAAPSGVVVSPTPPTGDAMPIYYNPNQQTTVVSAFPLSSLGIASNAIKEQGDMLIVKDKKILVIFAGQQVVAYDVADPKNPTKKWTFDIGNGTSVVTSRLKDGTIYLVTNTWINQSSPCPILPMTRGGIGMPILCTDIWVPSSVEPENALYTITALDPVTGATTNKLTIAGDSNNTVVSMFENNLYLTYRSQTAMTGVLIDFYRTQLADFLSAATIARIQTINSYDISSASKLNEVQIAINATLVGMNADQQLKFNNDVQNRLSSYLDSRARDLDRSTIVRVSLSTLTIAATGMIPGHLLNQFSLDEYQNNLRAAVTIGDQWGMAGGKQKNDVYVLDTGLTTIGSVLDLGLNEQIYAARFIGSRGYLVTFRQTDPFYVLDLSVPTAPKLAGQLKIPGYSSYLEPIDSTTVLGVGQEGSQVKLSLFDVINPANPVEKAKYTLAENWTEVSNNHHAFLRDDAHKVFFLPASQGGYVFSYAGGTLTLKATLSGYSISRAVYIDNYLYVIGQDKIAVFDETSWSKVKELSLK